jgi:hypothetical protein
VSDISKEVLAEFLESVHVDQSHIHCHFLYDDGNGRLKQVVSTVPFEPYEGPIVFTLKDILLHPLSSLHRYYHTPITVYSDSIDESIVKKAFEKISDRFYFDAEKRCLFAKHQ